MSDDFNNEEFANYRYTLSLVRGLQREKAFDISVRPTRVRQHKTACDAWYLGTSFEKYGKTSQ